jgi:hypothetical protein
MLEASTRAELRYKLSGFITDATEKYLGKAVV